MLEEDVVRDRMRRRHASFDVLWIPTTLWDTFFAVRILDTCRKSCYMGNRLEPSKLYACPNDCGNVGYLDFMTWLGCDVKTTTPPSPVVFAGMDPLLAGNATFYKRYLLDLLRGPGLLSDRHNLLRSWPLPDFFTDTDKDDTEDGTEHYPSPTHPRVLTSLLHAPVQHYLMREMELIGDGRQSLLMKGIEMELKARLEDSVLLFRHSAGVKINPDKVKWVLDRAISKNAGQLEVKSIDSPGTLEVVDFPLNLISAAIVLKDLSYSYSLLAGLIYDPGDFRQRGACTFVFVPYIYRCSHSLSTDIPTRPCRWTTGVTGAILKSGNTE
jgi:hypothetical protein